MQENTKLLCFETNKDFFSILKEINDKRLILINDSAENINFYLEHYCFDFADYIISSLPLVSFSKEFEGRIINCTFSSLKSGGIYIQYQYSLYSYSKFRKLYGQVKLGFTFFNIPPAFIYFCQKPPVIATAQQR